MRTLRPRSAALALTALLAGCSEDPSPPRDAGSNDLGADADLRDAPSDLDGAPALDAVTADAPDVADGADAGPRVGWVRFVNLAPGAGAVRFLATSLPMYPPSRVEAVVREGESSGYLLTNSGDYYFDAWRADAPDGGATLVPQGNGGVYFNTGCTVALVGFPGGNEGDGTQRRLYRFPDLPVREPGTAPVRFIPAVADVLFNQVLEGSETLARRVQYLVPTGFRRLTPGLHTFALQDAARGALVGAPLSVNLEDGPAQTLFLWGLSDQDAGAPLRALLLNDIPVGR